MTVPPNSERQIVTFDSCGSTFDTILRVYDQNFTQQITVCDDCGPCGLKAVMSALLEPGDYMLVIEGFRAQSGRFEVPGGIFFGKKIILQWFRYSLSVDCDPAPLTVSGSYQGNIVCGQIFDGSTFLGVHNVGGSAREVHYGFEVPDGTAGERTITFSTCGSHFDTLLSIFSGDDLRRQFASCDDCGVCGSRATLTRILPPGNYSVVIEGFDGVNGMYQLEMLCGANNTRPTHVVPTATGSGTSNSTQQRRIGWLVATIAAFTVALAVFVCVAIRGGLNKQWGRQVAVGDNRAVPRQVPLEVPPPYNNGEVEHRLPTYHRGETGPVHDPPSFDDALISDTEANSTRSIEHPQELLTRRVVELEEHPEPEDAPPSYLEAEGHVASFV